MKIDGNTVLYYACIVMDDAKDNLKNLAMNRLNNDIEKSD